MKKFFLPDIIEATGGIVKSPVKIRYFKGISIDSRKVKKGELFIAMKGVNFDGHEFISDSIRGGASGVVYSKRRNAKEPAISSRNTVFIEVKDTLKALQNLAIFYRNKFPVPLVGITGSNGKTTVKEMTDTILRKKFVTIKNPGNFNNQIGLPLSILPLDREHEIAIIEMGMSNPGEIRELCQIAMPTVGIITNVSLAHAENFKNIDEIAKCKAELIFSMPDRGVAIINGDDPNLVKAIRKYRGNKITFGKNPENKITADEIKEKGLSVDFVLSIEGKRIPVSLPVVGEHNVYNALAASACACCFGVSAVDIKKGLESYRGVHLRMEITRTRKGINILNDSYNANPASMAKALDAFAKIKTGGKKILLLGDMLELGKFAVRCHRETGFIAGEGKYDFLITLGPLAKVIGFAAVENGMPKNRVRSLNDSKKAVDFLKKHLTHGDWLLVKGSRGMKLDEIVDEIRNGS